MGTTVVALHLSEALRPRAFDEGARGDFEIGDAIARTDTRAQVGQPWLVARVHLTEALGQPFRCEVLITRQELFAPDPSNAAAVTTFWDQLSDRIDDGDATDMSGGRRDDLMGALDRLAGQDLVNEDASGNPTGIGGLPAALGQAVGDARQIYRDQAKEWQSGMDDWQSYLLGIPPATTWNPEVPPDPREFLGTFRSVLVRREGSGPPLGRWISGIVTEVEDHGLFGDDRRLVRLVIEPRLARLALRRNHRIFERMDALQILDAIFSPKEASVYLEGYVKPPAKPATREHCVQYGETDLDFVLRLCSEEGWVPVFEHHLGAERLRLALPEELGAGHGVAGTGDGGEVETLGPDDLPRPGLHRHFRVSDDEECVYEFHVTQRVAPAVVRTRFADFSHHAASGPPHVRDHRADLPASAADDPSGLDLFPARTAFGFDDERGAQTDPVDHDRDAFLELHAARAGALVGRGRSNAVALTAGQLVTVRDAAGVDPAIYADAVRPFDRELLLVRVEALAEASPAPLGGKGGLSDLPPRPGGFLATAPTSYDARIEAVPREVVHVPPRRRAPLVDGVQTAITCSTVSQPDGTSFLGVDAIGRVRARLRWDRDVERVKGERAVSPPIRVAGPWAGHGWGTTFLPREGMELVVAFRDGDPLAPIALGCAYSNVMPALRERPHLDVVGRDNHLGDEAVRGDERRLHYQHDPIREVEDRHLNGVRTRSHAGALGAPERAKGYHELSFDDTPRKERVRLHSEGALEQTAKNDHRTLVGRDQINVVSGSQREAIGGDQTLRVDGRRETEVVGHERTRVGEGHTLTVRGDATLEVGEDLSRAVKKDETIELGASPGAAFTRALEVREGRTTIVEAGDDTLEVGGDVTVRAEGTFELGGAPLTMKALGASGDPDDPNAPAIETDEDGTMTMSAPAPDGAVKLEAEGDVRIRATDALFDATTSIRFECGDAWVELTGDALAMNAPGGLYLRTSGDPGTRMFAGPKEGYGDEGEILFTVEASASARDSKRTAVLLRGAEDETDPADALTGDRGWKIEDADTVVIEGGLAKLECRRIELQKGEGAKRVVRDLDAEDREALEQLAHWEERVEDLTDRVRELEAEVRERRAQLKQAAELRRIQEESIERAGGELDDLADALAEVREAEDAVKMAEARLARAKLARRDAEAAHEDTSDEDDELEDAEEELEDARSELSEAEEGLRDERDRYGGMIDHLEAVRERERSAEAALMESVRELAAARRQLAHAREQRMRWRAKAEARELDGVEPEAAQ